MATASNTTMTYPSWAYITLIEMYHQKNTKSSLHIQQVLAEGVRIAQVELMVKFLVQRFILEQSVFARVKHVYPLSKDDSV
jgi:hypothetical protein